MKIKALAAVVLVGSIASACASSPEPSPFPGEMGGLIERATNAHLSDDSRTLEFLEDGVVTLEEYRQGFADEVACLENDGVVVDSQYVNKLDSWRMLFTAHSSTDDPNAGGGCGTNHRMYLELAYGLTSEGRVDARLLANSMECLQAIDGPLNGTERSVTDLVDSTGNLDAVLDCLTLSMNELYPGESTVYAP